MQEGGGQLIKIECKNITKEKELKDIVKNVMVMLISINSIVQYVYQLDKRNRKKDITLNKLNIGNKDMRIEIRMLTMLI